MLFRDLSTEEEVTFRQWARENYSADTEVSPLWHPVVRDEWARIERELA